MREELNQEKFQTLTSFASEITEMHRQLNEWNKIAVDLENELSQQKRIEEESRTARASLEEQLASSNTERELLLQKLEHEVKERKRIEEKLRKSPRYKAYLVAASIVIIITGATVIISQQHRFVPKVAFKPQEIVAPAVLVPPVLPGKQNTVQLISPPKHNVPVVEKKEQIAINKGSNTLVIRATEETWLRIKIDQNPAFQVFLKPGEIIERKGTGFQLDIGNAGGITIHFKGKLIKNLGNPGQVIHMRLPVTFH